MIWIKTKQSLKSNVLFQLVYLLVPSIKAFFFLFSYARKWLDKLTPLWKVALQWTHTFLLNSPFSETEQQQYCVQHREENADFTYERWREKGSRYSPFKEFGKAESLDPEQCSPFEETVNEFFDKCNALTLVSSWHFLFFRIPIKAVAPESEFLTSNFESSCISSDSVSSKGNVRGLASMQSFASMGDGVNRPAMGNFGEVLYGKWSRLLPRICNARSSSFLSRISSRSNINGVFFFDVRLLPSFLRWPRMWLDCPVLLSNVSPHNGQECMLFTVSESVFTRIAGRRKTKKTC